MKGHLIYLVGASGSGKDTLLNSLRLDQNSITNLVIMHRYITRASGVGNENHIPLSNDEFLNRRENGQFSLNWQAHETLYGIGKELDECLEKGINVIVNGSRAYFPQALIKYPHIHLVWLSVDSDILLQRLIERKREPLPIIQQRVERNKELDKIKPSNCFTINNDGNIESTIKQLQTVLSDIV